MMKLTALITIGFWTTLNANAALSLNCESKPSNWFDNLSVSVAAPKFVFRHANDATLYSPIVTVKFEDGSQNIGRIDYLFADKNFKSEKYKNHSQFDFTKLIDTESFGPFSPGGDCQIKFVFSNNILKEKSTFSATLLMSCESNSGILTMDCYTH